MPTEKRPGEALTTHTQGLRLSTRLCQSVRSNSHDFLFPSKIFKLWKYKRSSKFWSSSPYLCFQPWKTVSLTSTHSPHRLLLLLHLDSQAVSQSPSPFLLSNGFLLQVFRFLDRHRPLSLCLFSPCLRRGSPYCGSYVRRQNHLPPPPD